MSAPDKPTDPWEELRNIRCEITGDGPGLPYFAEWASRIEDCIAAWEKERAFLAEVQDDLGKEEDALTALRAEVQRVEEEMRAEAKMRMECENVAPDEYGYLIHQADRLRKARTNEGGDCPTR